MSFRALVTLVALVVGLGVVVAPTAHAKVRRPTQEWDPGIESIAHRVEQLRGLTFRFPVRVELLGRGSSFRSFSSSTRSPSMARELRHLQALGLLSADATPASLALASAGSPLGEYLPATKSINIYLTRVDALTRVVIAHELTHALDDQHYHFTRAERTVRSLNSERAFHASIEGDARRIEDAYFAGLPVAERRRAARIYDRLRAERHASAAGAAALEWETVLADAPYTLGRQLTTLALATRDERGLGALLTHAPLDDRSILDPTATGLRNLPWISVLPSLEPGEVADGRERTGALQTYLVLASRTTPDVAFRAVTSSVGAGTVWFRRDGTPCAHVALRPRPGKASDVTHAVDAFVAAAGPAASRHASGGDVVLTTCRGVSAVEPGTISTAELVLAARIHALAAASNDHSTGSERRCLADTVLGDAQYRTAISGASSIRLLGHVDGQFAGALGRAHRACRQPPAP